MKTKCTLNKYIVGIYIGFSATLHRVSTQITKKNEPNFTAFVFLRPQNYIFGYHKFYKAFATNNLYFEFWFIFFFENFLKKPQNTYIKTQSYVFSTQSKLSFDCNVAVSLGLFSGTEWLNLGIRYSSYYVHAKIHGSRIDWQIEWPLFTIQLVLQ